MRNGKGRKQKPKKTASEITPGVEKRIVAVSLKHPDYGARRLAILLEKEGIEVTDSAVYSILKRNGLQNKTLRLSTTKAQEVAEKFPVPAGTVSPPVDEKEKKTAREITPGIEERIVEVSLKHPDYGARRLTPLLEQEGIEVADSAVYSILKRNGLQNRSLRLSKLAVQQGAEKSTVPTGTLSPPVDQADRVSVYTEHITPQLRVAASGKSDKNNNSRSRWPLSILNLLLLAFAGFFCVSAVGNFTQARYEQGLSAEPASAQTTPESDISVRPLSDYDLIADRNLFGLAREGGPEHEEKQQEEIPLEEMPVAEKNLGLSLIGTVAAKKSKLRSAIIENSETRVQTIYHEGDKIEDILVKRILRDNVILGTSGGEKVLTIAFEQTSERSRSPNQAVSKKDETGGYSLKYQRRVRGMLTRSSGQSVSKHDQTVGDSSKPHRRVRGILRRK